MKAYSEPSPKDPGHVYIAQVASGPVKIGFTGQEVSDRIRHLSFDGERPALITSVAFERSTAFCIEQALHAAFAPDAISFEWYRPTEQIKALAAAWGGRLQVCSDSGSPARRQRRIPSDAHIVELNGKLVTLADAARDARIRMSTAWGRLASGWTPEETFSTPVRHKTSAERMKRGPNTVADTLGRRMLQEAIDSGKSAASIAKSICVANPAVSQWLHRWSRPAAAKRRMLFALLGIPEEAWELPEERAARIRCASEAMQARTGTDG